jgi:hypothetical protein
MPNWCDNSVTLNNSDKSKIDALETELKKDDPEVFNSIYPNPTGEWQYDWSCTNWGTKWDAHVIDWSRNNDNEIFISFDSAWSPPITFYEYLVNNGWKVDAIYHEPGMCYCGTYDTDCGDQYYEYDITNLESIEALPEDCIEFGGLRDEHEWWKESQEEEE